MVLLTLAHCLLRLRWGQSRNIILLLLLLTGFFTEAGLIVCSILNLGNGILVTLSIILFDSLWLLLLGRYFALSYWKVIIAVFFTIAILNILSVEGSFHFNYWTFVAGALGYVTVFIRESIIRLRNEELTFMTSNNYLLLCAPLLFFLALSMLFGFKSRALATTALLGSVTLYEVVIYFVNIFYYGIINIYLFQTKKHLYAR